MTTTKRCLAVFLLLVGLNACGDDPSPSGGDTNTDQGSDSDGGGYN